MERSIVICNKEVEKTIVPGILLIIFIIAAFYTDIRTCKIPNLLTVSTAFLGIVYHTSIEKWQGLLFSLTGLMSGLLALSVLYLFKAIGAGDVKLFAAIGALMGTSFMFHILFYSILYAGLIGFFIMIWKKELGRRISMLLKQIWLLFIFKDAKQLEFVARNKELLTFPFMLAVVPGTATAAFYLI